LPYDFRTVFPTKRNTEETITGLQQDERNKTITGLQQNERNKAITGL
jgi:hypothetical protein